MDNFKEEMIVGTHSHLPSFLLSFSDYEAAVEFGRAESTLALGMNFGLSESVKSFTLATVIGPCHNSS